MNIHRTGVVLVVGMPSPAQSGIIIHDAADVPPVTWIMVPDV